MPMIMSDDSLGTGPQLYLGPVIGWKFTRSPQGSY